MGGAVYSRYCLYPLGTEENVYFLDKNGALWFITAYFCAYMIFYFCLWYIEQGEKIFRTVNVLVALLAMTMLLSRLPILLPWSLDSAFIGAFFMLFGYYFKLQIDKKAVNRFDLGIATITVIAIYSFLVQINPSVNMSVRIYGNNGMISIFFFAICGVLGSWLYMIIGKIVSFVYPLKKIFLIVQKNAFALLTLQFEVYDILHKVFKKTEFANYKEAYWYGVLIAISNIVICVVIGEILRRITRGLTKSKIESNN